MKKVIVRETSINTVYLDDLKAEVPIFAKKSGKLVGMVVLEYFLNDRKPRGWILRIGESLGSHGHSETLEECIAMGINLGFEFYVED